MEIIIVVSLTFVAFSRLEIYGHLFAIGETIQSDGTLVDGARRVVHDSIELRAVAWRTNQNANFN